MGRFYPGRCSKSRPKAASTSMRRCCRNTAAPPPLPGRFITASENRRHDHSHVHRAGCRRHLGPGKSFHRRPGNGRRTGMSSRTDRRHVWPCASIEQIAAGTSKGVPQDKSQVTKAPKLTKENGLIDWNSFRERDLQSDSSDAALADALYVFASPQGNARALVGFPGRRGFGCHACSGRATGRTHPPTARHAADLRGNRGRRRGQNLELQPAGKRRMTAEDFLRGCPIQNGWRLGGETP